MDRHLARILGPVTALADELSATEVTQAKEERDRIMASYRSSRSTLLALAAFAILVGFCALLWLIRDIVPRTRSYSRFAARVASGAASEPIGPRGSDELAELGGTLNAMVAQREAERAYGESQAEFADAMQVTESEDEVHGLFKRHLERSIPASTVVVLNRNKQP